MLYDKGPLPLPGSFQELVHLLVFQSRINADLVRTRAVAQASLGGDKAVEAFDEFKNALLSPTRNKQRKDMAEALEKVAKMGPIAFRPLINPREKRLPKVHRDKT